MKSHLLNPMLMESFSSTKLTRKLLNYYFWVNLMFKLSLLFRHYIGPLCTEFILHCL